MGIFGKILAAVGFEDNDAKVAEALAPVSVEAVIANLNANVDIAKQAIRNIVVKLAGEPDWPSHHALANAIISSRIRQDVPAGTWEKLGLFIGEYYS